MRRHHVVSQGYQRLFADGKRIRLVWKDSGQSKLVGTRDAFVERGFHAVHADGESSDALEDEWARVERLALPGLRAAASGHQSPDTDYAIKAMMAMQWARSYAVREMFGLVFDRNRSRAATDLAQSEHLPVLFEDQYGRPPHPGEIEEYVHGRLEEMRHGNALFVERIAHLHNKAVERFAELHVQLVMVGRPVFGFLTSDNPVVISDGARVGVQSGLALLDACHVYMPLSRWAAALLTTGNEGSAVGNPMTVQILNNLTWRNSLTQLASHPSEDWLRALGRSPGTA